jgi:hypothetical protein
MEGSSRGLERRPCHWFGRASAAVEGRLGPQCDPEMAQAYFDLWARIAKETAPAGKTGPSTCMGESTVLSAGRTLVMCLFSTIHHEGDGSEAE